MARQRPAYATTQFFGLALMASAMVAVTIVGLLLFDAEESYWPVAAASILFAFVVWRFDGVWARALGLLGTLALGAAMFFFAFGVFQPFSPVEFIVGLVFVLGVITALAGGIMTLAVGRRRDPGPTAAGRRFRRVTLGLIGVAALVSVTGFFLTRTTVTEAEAQDAVRVEMANFEFAPEATTLVADKSLLLVNEDAFAHDFTLDDFDIQVHTGPGSEAVVDLGAVPPGTYTYFCSLHTDPSTGEGMTGELTIEG